MTHTEDPADYVVTIPRRGGVMGGGGKMHKPGCRHIKPLTWTRPATDRDLLRMYADRRCACAKVKL